MKAAKQKEKANKDMVQACGEIPWWGWVFSLGIVPAICYIHAEVKTSGY